MTTPASVCASCGTPLTADAAFCMSCGAATGAPVPPDTSTFAILQAGLEGRYRIERELGKGGMATVFLAQDLRHDRHVAIKVLHPELAASMGAERFDREIKLSAKLQHPHILSLYDSGHAGSLLFYVMPFVKGESLRDRLDREQMLPVEDAIAITLEVADALGYAHALGIVHRDIKPENIMLSGGHALVADFGIARAASGEDGGQKLTQTGTAIGTPLYMSPEQASGDPVGPTSDLYSLACVAFEMLTGQPPFTGANARAIMARHTMEMVPSLRLVRDSVPEEVENALFAALEKASADRPQTAKKFAEMLTGAVGVTTTGRAAARSRMTTARTTIVTVPWWRRPAVLGGGAAAAVLIAAGAWLATHRKPASVADLGRQEIAVPYFRTEGNDTSLVYLADGLTEGLIRTLSQVGGLHVRSRIAVEPFRGSTAPLDSIARALDAGTLVDGRVERRGERIRVSVKLVDRSGNDVGQGASFEAPAANAIAISDTLTRRVADLVRGQLGTEVRLQDLRSGTRSTEAWVLLQRAELLRQQADSLGATGDTVRQGQRYAAADSLAGLAERADPRWVDPVVARGTAAYRRSRGYVGDPIAARRWITVGLGHADRALRMDSANADALELRGNLNYFTFLLQLEPDARRAAALFASARSDLEKATRVRPAQAGAWASLSHLYANDSSKTPLDITEAAQNALDADAYLANANVILSRQFFGYYDMGNEARADAVCQLGHTRFTGDPKFTECRLWLLTMRARDSSAVRRAWALTDSVVALMPPADSEYQRLAGRMATAAVLVRAGLSDSARHVVARSQGNSTVDPSADLANIGAFVYSLLYEREHKAADATQALEFLRRYIATNPSRRNAIAGGQGWWFKALTANPDFQRLAATGR